MYPTGVPTVTFRDHVEGGDLDAVLAMNQADVRHLSGLTAASLERLAKSASYLRIAQLDGRDAGFLLVLPAEASYASENFQWFKRRYSRFLYVDRVVVAPHARREGIASRLYRDLEVYAGASGASVIACEINVRPANPESVAFHDRHGFVEVGTQDTEHGTKTVSMRIKQLAR